VGGKGEVGDYVALFRLPHEGPAGVHRRGMQGTGSQPGVQFFLAAAEPAQVVVIR
jgi:hypothetical protein